MRERSLCLLFLLLINLASGAAQYYISPTGSDSNSGTLSLPWRTEQHSQRILQPGDTVFFRGGNYSNLVLTASGTPASPISYRANTNEKPVVLQAIGSSSPVGIDLSGDNCIISGFTVQGGSDGIRINGSSHATNNVIENCDVTKTWITGMSVSYGDHSWTTIRNCRVYNCSLENWPRTNSSWGGGISIGKGIGTHCLVENCLVYFNNGEAILTTANNCTVKNCIIADNYRASMYCNGDNNMFENNVNYCTKAGLQINLGSFGVATLVTQEGQNIATNTIGLRGTLIVNNLLVNAAYGLTVENFESPYTNYPFSDIVFANNTCIVGNQAIQVTADPGYPTSGPYNNFHIFNNLFLASPLAPSPYFWEIAKYPNYPIDFGNDIYDFQTSSFFQWGSNGWYYSGGGLTNWMLASGETNAGPRASLWLTDTNLANNIISNVLQAASVMPRLWQTNSGPPPDLDISWVFTNLATCSNNIFALRKKLAAPFRPLNDTNNVALHAGRQFPDWTWVDDFGVTNTVTAPIATDLMGYSRSGNPTIGALEPRAQGPSPPSALDVVPPSGLASLNGGK